MNRISAVRKAFEEKIAALTQKRKSRITAFRKKLDQARIEQLRNSLLGK